MKNLEKIFIPRSIAIIGASAERKSLGWGLLKNVISGRGLRKIFCVNPYRKKILDIRCYSKITDIRERVDLAIIAVNAKIVPQIVKECCQKKVGGMIIISAGFAETGEKGKILQQKITQITKKAKIPLVGPNCLGVIRPSIKLNASFAPAMPKEGEIAFVSQSGALLGSVIDKALLEDCGFSNLVSYGNEADITLSDFLLWLKGDKETKVIVLYLEGLKNGRDFMKVAKNVSKVKPVIAVKAGKTGAGAEAVSSHTDALVGSHQIYSAAFLQSGIVEVNTIEELLDVAKAFSWQPTCKNGIGILTNGGGCGVLIADYCEQLGINLPKLSQETIKKLENSKVIHPAISKRNPLDIWGDALSNRYKAGIEALLEQKNIYGLIVIQTLQIMTESKKNAEVIIKAKKKWPQKPIVTAIMEGKFSRPGIQLLKKNKIPNFTDLKRAAFSMRALIGMAATMESSTRPGLSI